MLDEEEPFAKPNFTLPFTTNEIIAPSVLIWLFFVVGILLNGLTIRVISLNPKLKNPFMLFIISLCISDLTSALISPLFWYRRTLGFDVWKPPKFLCTFYWAADLWTSYVTATHILSFAALRYISIEFRSTFKKIKLRHTKFYILFLWWFCGMVGFLPFCFFFGAGNPDRNSDAPNSRWPACTIIPEWIGIYTIYIRIAFPLFLCLPIVLVIILSLIIGFTVGSQRARVSSSLNEKSRKKRHVKEKRAFIQLFLIAVCFIFAYIPFVAYETWATTDIPGGDYWKAVDYWFGTTEYLFLRLSECLNPIFYNLGSTRMRKSTKKYLLSLARCRGETNDVVSVSSTSVGVTATAVVVRNTTEV